MDINIGKILIQPKDNWNATTPYAYLNLVRYNKKLYICKSVTGAPAGTLPTNTSYYMETTQDGIDAQEIQLQKTATEIQWKRTGETTWTTLVTLAAIKGDKGDTGAKGDQGLKGDKGDTGAKGDQGLKGDTGAKGDQGLKGDKGDPGNLTGPASSTDGNIPIFDGVGGDLLKDSGVKLGDKADVASPTFTGDVIVPDQSAGNNSTKAANTKYVDAGLGLKANTTDVDDALALKADSADVAQLALQLGNTLLELENQNTLAEAIMQNNLNVNSSFDRIEVTEAELVDIEKVVLNAELSTRMSAMRAAQSETNARISASESAAAKTAAEFARNESQSARNDSQAARNDSRIAKAAAETAAGNAASSETAAQRAQAGAGTAQTGAETARTGAETARASAERAEGAAEAARDAASVSEANAQRTYFNVAQLALQLGNPLLELENQNTLAEAILQENLLINNIYDRLEGGIYAAI